MRLKTLVAPDPQQAMAMLRAELGADAIIVATRELADGGVRITGAIENEDLDLAELLAPPRRASRAIERLAAMAAHHELPESLRARLLDVASATLDDDPLAALNQALHATFRFEPLALAGGAPLLLSGPPGAGKTATVAKLAARAVLDGRSVAVATTDTSRAGGLEQLRALLAPLQLRPESASEPAALRQLVAQRVADLLLIDTPGLNPFKPSDLGLLSTLLEASGGQPVLVLAAGLGVADCADIGHTYAALGARRLLATKLDAAKRLGGMLAAAAAGLAFCEAGIGPTIGQGLSPMTAAGLARLLLRREAMAGGGQRATGEAE